ncbi:KTSC domain-containing protein [candidate division WOR-3 bacterium]|nr:KTSC domain-containing protein [candidate division WOR-3 bacterium]
MTGYGKRLLTIPTLLLSLTLLVAATAVGCGKKSAPAPQAGATHVEQAQSDDPGSVSYDEGSRRLIITFRSGSVYEYTDVPRDVYLGISAAPAKGVYLNTYVKDRYPFRVTTSGPAGSTVIQIQGGESKPAKPPQSSQGRGRGR